MTEIPTQRVTAAVDGEVVVFLIGMRINEPWKVHKWLPFGLARATQLVPVAGHRESAGGRLRGRRIRSNS